MWGESGNEATARIDNDGGWGCTVHCVFMHAVYKIAEQKISFSMNTAAIAAGRRRLSLAWTQLVTYGTLPQLLFLTHFVIRMSIASLEPSRTWRMRAGLSGASSPVLSW
jgi:hypothetical protein